MPSFGPKQPSDNCLGHQCCFRRHNCQGSRTRQETPENTSPMPHKRRVSSKHSTFAQTARRHARNAMTPNETPERAKGQPYTVLSVWRRKGSSQRLSRCCVLRIVFRLPLGQLLDSSAGSRWPVSHQGLDISCEGHHSKSGGCVRIFSLSA